MALGLPVPTVGVTTFFKSKRTPKYLFAINQMACLNFRMDSSYHRLQVRSEAKTSKAFRAASDISSSSRAAILVWRKIKGQGKRCVLAVDLKFALFLQYPPVRWTSANLKVLQEIVKVGMLEGPLGRNPLAWIVGQHLLSESVYAQRNKEIPEEDQSHPHPVVGQPN